ncbi:hypothetical protein [Halovivax gelatinilyticus]|uniref:hypothetical protein n=1 Tax=Halovivax gelatinilyticus TaxID=2961597 RepID=UPI0020CA3B6B|nr:hypothetical protein [Halovivax gelatinilyticus]
MTSKREDDHPQPVTIDGESIRSSTHLRTHDSTNNITYHLAQLKNEEWVHWQVTYTTQGQNETVLQRGTRLTIEEYPLDSDTVTSALNDAIERHFDATSPDLDQSDLTTLEQNTTEIAAHIADSWAGASEAAIGSYLHDQALGVGKTTLWMRNIGETKPRLIQNILDEFDLSSQPASETVIDALDVAVSSERSAWLQPHMMFEAELVIE